MALSVEERDELRVTARSLLARDSSSERVRAVIAEEPGFDRSLWEQMVELGWTTIHVAEDDGGAGCGYGDLAVILHELGRAVTPSPFLASAVLATSALSLADPGGAARELLAPLVAGESLGAVALANAQGSYDFARATTSWSREGGSIRLQGSAGFVLDADLAGVLVVAARAADGAIAAIAVDANGPGVVIERAVIVDETRRMFRVAFHDVVVGQDRLLCEPGPAAEALLDRVLSLGTVAAACDATGAAEAALEQAASYAKERLQFGKPIGSFQAVKHHCANMAIAVEASRAATSAAADALDEDGADWATHASIVASYVGPACSEACGLGLRVHAGIGFTWEHDTHLFMKRVKLDEMLFGSPGWHRRRLADAVFPAIVAS
jgi:alkylation response protein AidB-like acyl-CoA dehydrogenase